MALIGPDKIYVSVGGTYTELSANGVSGADLNVVITNQTNIDINTPGIDSVIYTGTDDNGNIATISRIVQVVGLPVDDILIWIDASLSDGKIDLTSGKHF